MTDNILTISILEHSNIPLEKETFRLDKQLCEVIVDFNRQWEQKKIEVEMELDAITITSYRTLLVRVWSNLMQNAIKFTDKNGLIKITCQIIDDKVEVMFQDNGIGMDKQTQKHMMDKFYQGDSSRTTEGNGLGLALVKKIIHECQGDIVVNSQLQKGSAFYIYLPKDEK